MKLLAIDCATGACSAAVWADGGVRARRFELRPRGQAEALMPMVAAVMAEAGLDFAALDGLATTVGPGSFTGLRAGIAAARAMALAAELPLIGVTTLEAVAQGIDAGFRDGRASVVVLETKRIEVYAQSFSADLSPLGEAAALSPAAVAAALPDGPLVIAGDAAGRLGAEIGATRRKAVRFAAGPGLPDAADIAAIAVARGIAEPGDGAGKPAGAVTPLYLHPSYARTPAPDSSRDPESSKDKA